MPLKHHTVNLKDEILSEVFSQIHSGILSGFLQEFVQKLDQDFFLAVASVIDVEVSHEIVLGIPR